MSDIERFCPLPPGFCPLPPGDRLFVGDQPFPDGAALVWPEDTEELGLALEPKPDMVPRFDTTLAVKRFGPRRVLVRYAVRAARRISRIPRDAQVVVILDFSRSVEQQFAEAEVAAGQAYLRHLPGAKVQILTFDRRVRRRLGAFMSVARALARLGQLVPERGNGSALDAALRDADKLLRGQPPGHARRVVLLTDLRTRSALDPATLRSALRPSGALLHIVTVEAFSDGDEFEPALTRNDEDQRWTPVARATGGLLWSTEISTASEQRGALERTYEELARPMRVDRFRITVPGVELEPDDGDEILERAELAEGEMVDGLQIAETAAPWLELRGELWATPFRTRVAPNTVEAHRWSALAFGSSLLEELTEPEMMVLARYGRAVSPVTSYLAIEPGVRPSTEGLEEGSGYGSGGLGLVGTGSGGGGYGIGQVLPPFDPQAWLRAELRERWRRCAAENQRATVVLETTDDEIVDVMNVTTSSRASGACLREATWGLELSDRFTDDRATWTVQL